LTDQPVSDGTAKPACSSPVHTFAPGSCSAGGSCREPSGVEGSSGMGRAVEDHDVGSLQNETEAHVNLPGEMAIALDRSLDRASLGEENLAVDHVLDEQQPLASSIVAPEELCPAAPSIPQPDTATGGNLLGDATGRTIHFGVQHGDLAPARALNSSRLRPMLGLFGVRTCMQRHRPMEPATTAGMYGV